MPTAADIAHAIDELLTRRDGASSIWPSEVARKLWPQDWRQHMFDVREVALAQMREGRLLITQGGQAVDAEQPLQGAIRLRRPLAAD